MQIVSSLLLTAYQQRNIVARNSTTGAFTGMTDQPLLALESKLDQLIQECNRLNADNVALKQELADAKLRESDWASERSRLIEKNEIAKTRVEAMITRLKSLEEQAG